MTDNNVTKQIRNNTEGCDIYLISKNPMKGKHTM